MDTHARTVLQGLALFGAVILGGACTPEPTAVVAPSVVATDVTAAPRVLMDEPFQRTWPNEPEGPAWLGASGGYRLFARRAGRFVAIRAPLEAVPADVIVSGSFHKLGGPPGGGYGLIVRDQAESAGNGLDQNGRYVVAEVGDRGEVGIWQRAQSEWLMLVPWTPAAAVHPGVASNTLTVQVRGDRLTFVVNGTQVADVRIGLAGGAVGVFTGGDGNLVQLDRFTVQTVPVGPDTASVPRLDPAEVSRAQQQLQHLAQRARTDASALDDADWRQQLADAASILQRAHEIATAASEEGQQASEAQRLQHELGSVMNDLSAVADVFAGGIDSPHSPVNDPVARRQAAAHLDSAVQQASAIIDEIQAMANQP